MRIGKAISITTLAVSTAALALVLWLVITQPWIVEEPVPVVATPTFTDDEVLNAVRGHLMTPGMSPLCIGVLTAARFMDKNVDKRASVS